MKHLPNTIFSTKTGYLFIILILFFTGNEINAQQFTLKGKVVNESKILVEYANASLIKNDSLLLNETETDSLGNFLLLAEKGNYTILITQFGNEFLKKEIYVDQDTNIGELMINDTTMLEGVTLTARKKLIERKIDRLVYNIEDVTSLAGADALDALKITPRVKVQNDQISIIGKSTMSIMVNDRLIQLSGDDLTNYLKTIKSDDIKNIEVITSPPSKYNAEGNSGIVNIITKKIKSNMWDGSLQTSYKQASYATGSGSGSFNMKRDKLELISSVSYVNGAVAPVETSKIYYPGIDWGEVNNRKDNSNAISFNLGLDYALTQKLSTGITFKHVNSKPIIEDNNRSYVLNSQSHLVDSLFITNGRNNKELISNQFNYHLVYKIDSIGRKLSLDYDFFKYKSNSERFFNTKKGTEDQINPLTSALNIGNQNIQNNSVNIDMEHPTAWASINYGGKLSFIETSNDFLYYNFKNDIPVVDPTNSNSFAYTENTQSLYLSIHKEINEKWEAKIGIRMENTQTKGVSAALNEINRMRYTEFFPTAYIVYNLNANNTFNINYGKRIQRPSYNFLNPFRWVISPYMYSEGNPFVQPSFAHNLELGYNYKDNLNTSIYFSQVNDGFGQVTFLDNETNIRKILVRNYLLSNTIGLSQIIVINPMSWLGVNFSGDIYYSSAKSRIPEALPSLNGWNGVFTMNTDIILNKDNTAFLNMNYIFVTAGEEGLFKGSQFSQFDVSFKYLVLDKKLTLAVHANDVFSSNRPTYTTYNNSIKNSFQNYYDIRFVRFSVAYNFGKAFNKEKRKETNLEEYNRVK